MRFTVEERPNEDSSTLFAVFGASSTAIAHEIGLDELNALPALRAPLAVALAAAAARRNTIPSRHGLRLGLRVLVAFLVEQGQTQITPEMIDEDLRIRLVAWLNRAADGRAVLLISSRKTRYSAIAQIVATGMGRGILGSPAYPYDLEAKPWKGQHEPQVPQEKFLDPLSMTTILRFCADDADATIREIEPLLDALDSGDHRRAAVAEARRIRTVILDAAKRSVRIDPSDATVSLVDRHTQNLARRMVLPRYADLTPFAILLSHYTTFNPATLFGLKVKDVNSVAMGSAGFVTLRAFKPRRGADDEAIFSIDSSPTNPDRLLRFILRWTSMIREATGSGLVWVAAGKHCFHLPEEDVSGEQPGRLFDLGMWLRRRKLPHATFSSIRAGVRDLAHLAADADRSAISDMGGQSEQTIDKHYVSPRARRTERARVATAADNYERWISSAGKVDARTLPDLSDRTAATPGFSCLDNRASPMTGMHGRSCTAYGMCAICPLATVDVTSARACGYLHLLLDAVSACFDASDLMTAAPVLATWAPVARKLRDVWLPAFAPETHAAAALLPLPRLPDLE